MRALISWMCPSTWASSVDSYVPKYRHRKYTPTRIGSSTKSAISPRRRRFGFFTTRLGGASVLTSSTSVPGILLHLDQISNARLSQLHRSCEGRFGYAVSVCGGNQVIARGGHRFLRLHHFDGVRHACDESVTGLLQSLTG